MVIPKIKGKLFEVESGLGDGLDEQKPLLQSSSYVQHEDVS